MSPGHSPLMLVRAADLDIHTLARWPLRDLPGVRHDWPRWPLGGKWARAALSMPLPFLFRIIAGSSLRQRP
jgi:hypothetical protein